MHRSVNVSRSAAVLVPACVLAAVVAVVSAAAAELPAVDPACVTDLATDLPTATEAPVLPELSPEPSPMMAFCRATCFDGSTVSCSGNTCSATDSACPNVRGSVTCDGATQLCPQCPCTEGAFRIVRSGNCCPFNDGTEEVDILRCINGEFVFTGTECFPSRRCFIIP